MVTWPSGQKPHFFRWRQLGCWFKSRRGYLHFVFFHRFFLPFGFLLFILTADPVSFARFLRKRISSLCFLRGAWTRSV